MPKKSTINQYKYDSTHCRSFHLKLNLESDSDIIKKLEEVPSMQGYIKQLIRNDLTRTKSKSAPKKHMSLDDLYIFLQDHTEDYDGSMYELLNALTQKLMN